MADNINTSTNPPIRRLIIKNSTTISIISTAPPPPSHPSVPVPFTCSVCARKFRTQKNLDFHMIINHTDHEISKNSTMYSSAAPVPNSGESLMLLATAASFDDLDERLSNVKSSTKFMNFSKSSANVDDHQAAACDINQWACVTTAKRSHRDKTAVSGGELCLGSSSRSTIEREARYYGNFLEASTFEDQSDRKKKRKFSSDQFIAGGNHVENYDEGKKKKMKKKQQETVGVISFPADIAQETAPAHQCDVCGKSFPSCHALRGHKSIHKKAPPSVLIMMKKGSEEDPSASGGSHRCKVCGKVFAKGQALGGHMTCHNRQQYSSTLLSHTTNSNSDHDQLPPPPSSSSTTTDHDHGSASAIRGGASMEDVHVTTSRAPMTRDEVAAGSFDINVKDDDDATPIKFEFDLNDPAPTF